MAYVAGTKIIVHRHDRLFDILNDIVVPNDAIWCGPLAAPILSAYYWRWPRNLIDSASHERTLRAARNIAATIPRSMSMTS